MDNDLTIKHLNDLTKLSEKKSSKSHDEVLGVYDINMKKIGTAPRLLCHRLGLIHKVVYVLIRNHKNEFLIQTRSDGRLDVTVGGHMSIKDKSELQAATREASEELGFSVDEKRLKLISTFLRLNYQNIKNSTTINNEIRHLFIYDLNEKEENTIKNKFARRSNRFEVKDIRWMELSDVVYHCNSSKTADGLTSSLLNYLAWSYKQVR